MRLCVRVHNRTFNDLRTININSTGKHIYGLNIVIEYRHRICETHVILCQKEFWFIAVSQRNIVNTMPKYHPLYVQHQQNISSIVFFFSSIF